MRRLLVAAAIGGERERFGAPVVGLVLIGVVKVASHSITLAPCTDKFSVFIYVIASEAKVHCSDYSDQIRLVLCLISKTTTIQLRKLWRHCFQVNIVCDL